MYTSDGKTFEIRENVRATWYNPVSWVTSSDPVLGTASLDASGNIVVKSLKDSTNNVIGDPVSGGLPVSDLQNSAFLKSALGNVKNKVTNPSPTNPTPALVLAAELLPKDGSMSAAILRLSLSIRRLNPDFRYAPRFPR